MARELSLLEWFYGAPKPDPIRLPDPRKVLDPLPNERLVTIYGQPYREFDSVRGKMLTPVGRPPPSPDEIAQQRAASDRVAFMEANPLAAGAYGIASLLGASPRVRDIAMASGAVADATTVGAAPLGSRMRAPVKPPPVQPLLPSKLRDPFKYDPMTETNQARGGDARITQAMLDTGKRARRNLVLPGLFNSNLQDKGHVFAEGMGGTARTPQEAFALHQNANRGGMSKFEKSVIGRVRAGEVVDYWVKALYGSPNSAPTAVVLSANGSRGDFTPKVVLNRPGPAKK